MNAQATMQRRSPVGPSRSVPNSILIKIEVLGDVCLLHFKGHLHAGAQSDYLDARMTEIKRITCTKFLANFEDVASLGSTGLSFIVDLYNTAGGRFVLVNTQPRIREVLAITRLNTVIPLSADIESGLAALCVETQQT